MANLLSVTLIIVSGVIWAKSSDDVQNNIAAPAQFPFQVYIYIINFSDSVALCGGSIISSTFVLTAAHCCIQQKEFEIGFGTNLLGLPLFRRRTSKRIIHSKYDPVTYVNDIALIPVRRMTFNGNTQPIKLPSSSNANIAYTNKKVIISGWGRTANNTIPRNMQYKTFRVISNSDCAEVYENVFNTTLCGARWCNSSLQISCQGDSGGPLSYSNANGVVQLGIVSFGARDGCKKGYPVGFTRITSYLSWIAQKTRIRFE